MTRTFPLALLLAAASAAVAQPPPIPPAGEAKAAAAAVKAAGPRFPDFPRPPVPPAPTPTPAPPKADEPVVVAPGRYYVFTSDAELIVKQVGAGSLTVKDRGPKFHLPADKVVGWSPDRDNPEIVTFDAPHVYVARAEKADRDGPVTLVVVPVGVKAEKDILLKQLVVGKATPTPDPSPDVKPIPNPAKGLRVLMVWEKQANLTKEQLNVANSSRIAAYLNAKCAKDTAGRPEWRKWDASTIDRPGGLDRESAVWQQLWAAAKPKLGPLPQVVIVTDQAGVTIPWEATEDAMLALLQKYGG